MQEVITIDGPAGSGKSTISRELARRLRLFYLDTGAMYRAVALAAERRGLGPTQGRRLGELCRGLDLNFAGDAESPRLMLGREDVSQAIRSPRMDMLSSAVSAVREVRAAMVEQQRKIARGRPIVAEGRDMGTVVFPQAGHKFYLTASPEVRAERRYRERLERGENVSFKQLKDELGRRDRQDSGRSLAPLKPAEDAVTIDSTDLTADEVIARIMGNLDL